MGYSDKLAQLAAETFFSPEQLGLNIMRYNIGGGEHDNPECRIGDTSRRTESFYVFNEETGEYTVHYNVIIGEADWNTYKDTAAAYIAVYNGDDMLKIKSVSLTDALSSTVFAGFEEAPTDAKLIVVADKTSSLKPLVPVVEFAIN